MAHSNTTYTEQNILNESYDDEFKSLVFQQVQRKSDGSGLEFVSPATEAKQDDIISALGGGYNYIQSEETGTYKYYGFTNADGWQIKRKTLATGVWEIASGLFTGTYATYDLAWAARASITYNYT